MDRIERPYRGGLVRTEQVASPNIDDDNAVLDGEGIVVIGV
jgi:hypothetical protein